MADNICKACMHNCTDRKRKSCDVKGICWCNAGYGRVIKKKKTQCKDFIKKEKDNGKSV